MHLGCQCALLNETEVYLFAPGLRSTQGREIAANNFEGAIVEDHKVGGYLSAQRLLFINKEYFGSAQ